MEMNFPHPKHQRMQSQRSGDYSVLVAAAVARQMAGITTQFAFCGSKGFFGANDPVFARINYFSSASNAAGTNASGSFLPSDMFGTHKVNKIGAEIYSDASAICKPYLLYADSPEQPVAMRGMEN